MLEGWDARVQAALLREVGARVTGILDTTRDMIQEEVERGLNEGLSPGALADNLEDAAAFSEYRSELIARTESATFLNQAALANYDEFGVTHVEVIDGEGDDECAAANGQIWTLEEANANPIAHPNCVRDFVPVLDGRTGTEAAPAAEAATETDKLESGYRFGARDNEQGAVFNLQTGEVLEVGRGTNGATSFTNNIGGPNIGLTHSHPGIGGSFSPDDVRYAIQQRLGLMRAIDSQYVYELTRPEAGWPSWEKVRTLRGTVYTELFTDAYKAAIKVNDTARMAELDRLAASNEIVHDVWQTMADRYGLPYTRTRR